MDILNSAREFWNWTESIADPRVADWPLVYSPIPVYSLTLFYLIFSSWLGPKLMENHRPLELRMVLVLYNTAMTVLNLHIFKEDWLTRSCNFDVLFFIFVQLVLGAIDAGFSFPCEPYSLKDDAKHLRIAVAIWWYYISKPLEFLDTLFFVLRKKNDQITFLHLYHHATMPCLWWIGVKWAACGTSAYPAVYNSFIHVIMYTYYGIAACGPQYAKYLWWKKYLTMLQLIQFIIAMVHCMYVWLTGCKFISWMYHALNLYMVSFLILFGNFYVQAYVKKRRMVKGLEQKKD